MFSWRPIHEETAARLLNFEHRQEDLVTLLRDMDNAGLNVVPLTDKPSEKTEAPLAEIDPLTFMAVFNRPTTFRNKTAAWAYLKKAWNLRSEVPRDVHGIPTLSPQSAWFFPWKYRRRPQDIPSLWKLARYAIEGRWNEADPKLFTECLDIHTVGVGKLTTGLFWLAPTQILPLPSTTTGYLESKGFKTQVENKAEYDAVLARVRSELSTDLIQVSHDAWVYSAGYEPFVLNEEEVDRIWSVFRTAMPDFVDFSAPGEKLLKQELQYKRAGLKKFSEAGGRTEIERLLADNQSAEALKIFQRTVALNIASFQSWRRSIGEGNPKALSEVLAAFLEATKGPYSGVGTLLPVFDAMQRNELVPAWDTMSVVLWALRPTDYFPIKISHYRKLAEAFGQELAGGRPTAEAFDDLMAFGRAFWNAAKRAAPQDWVDVQSFLWVIGLNSGRLDGTEIVQPENSNTRSRKVWTIAPGEQARLWEEFFQDGIVGIGWDRLEDLTRYNSKEEIENTLKDQDQSTGRRSNDALACWEFARVMAPGDVVIAKKGREQVHGVGIVRGPYRFDTAREEYKHVRDVEWTHQGLWNVDSQFAMKTLTNTTPYPDFVRSVLKSVGAEALIEELFGPDVKPIALEEAPPPVPSTATPFDISAALADLFMTSATLSEIMGQLRRKQNLVLQGPPGVGKTFAARRLAYLLLGERDDTRIETVQFHPSTSYEDFIQGLRPDGKGGFVLKSGVFHRFCQKAQNDPLKRPHIFIIDEINRGNLAKVFGELMMLIESDKRGPGHAVSLAYDAEGAPRFYLPKNLYLIGTMNTADRSLALVDYALRRRFAFVNLDPNFGERFRESLLKRDCPADFIDLLCERIAALNETICADTRSLGRGYQIGHSYFCASEPITTPKTWLEEIVRFEIQPLLDEYWMDDVKKAQQEAEKLLA